jgi:16S rRNA (guanine527-N7)-methyltransferase
MAEAPVQATAGVAEAEAVFGPGFEDIKKYIDILATEGVTRGLIGPRETERLWDRHILNSVALAGLIPYDSEVVDVGSGAGLPGIPLAMLRPDLQMTLLEPLLRRASFLAETVEALGVGDRVRVVRSRAEEHGGAYAVVVARAVAPLTRLVPWCASLRRTDGVILALKGQSAAEEVAAAHRELAQAGLVPEVLSVRAHPDADLATVVRLRPAAS